MFPLERLPKELIDTIIDFRINKVKNESAKIIQWHFRENQTLIEYLYLFLSEPVKDEKGDFNHISALLKIIIRKKAILITSWYTIKHNINVKIDMFVSVNYPSNTYFYYVNILEKLYEVAFGHQFNYFYYQEYFPY